MLYVVYFLSKQACRADVSINGSEPLEANSSGEDEDERGQELALRAQFMRDMLFSTMLSGF